MERRFSCYCFVFHYFRGSVDLVPRVSHSAAIQTLSDGYCSIKTQISMEDCHINVAFVVEKKIITNNKKIVSKEILIDDSLIEGR